jgi:hypothetical protein
MLEVKILSWIKIRNLIKGIDKFFGGGYNVFRHCINAVQNSKGE